MIPFDERRNLAIFPTKEEAIRFAADHFLHTAARAMQQKGRFGVALSGGSTPKAIYQLLSHEKSSEIDWAKCFLFWSDERAVPPTHPDSNYRMAMEELGNLPIPKGQIFRMEGENNLATHAKNYEEKIDHFLGKSLFDLVMLGVGEDGHTASLFPGTEALQVTDQLVVPNFIPQKKSWRMTLTFPCIEQSQHVVIYAFGKEKREIVAKVLDAPILSHFPASRIGTSEKKALWILDAEAAQGLFNQALIEAK